MGEQLKVFSYGGGVQSTACLVLAAQGELDIKTFLFANVGDDSEHPATLRYVREVAMLYAKEQGLDIIEVRRRKRDGTLYPTLLGLVSSPNSRTIHIPVRMSNGAPGNRRCTSDYKITVVNGWLRNHGATRKNPALLSLGISLDEFQRMRTSEEAYRINRYPLIDRRMSRQDCVNVIHRAGLEVPPKSSCWFCPYHRMSRWQEMADKEPVLFKQAVELEAIINARRERIGKDHVYLTDRHVPLDKAVGTMSQGNLWDTEPTCDSGFCFM